MFTTVAQPATPAFGFGSSAPTGFGGFVWQNFAILLAHHLPGDEVAFIIIIMNLFTLPQEMLNLSPRVVAAYKEVSNYLGDLATITQEKRPYSWISDAPSLSPEAQTALTTSLLGLTLKLTGAKLANFKFKLPGAKMRIRSRTEVVAYLALIQVCKLVTNGFPIISLSPLRTLWTPWLAAGTGRRPPRTPTLTRCTLTSPRLLPFSR